jgi:hypothetical protein
VRASSAGQGSARLDLTCAAGAALNIRRGSESRSDDTAKTLRLQVPTSAYRGIVDGARARDVEVATVNF